MTATQPETGRSVMLRTELSKPCNIGTILPSNLAALFPAVMDRIFCWCLVLKQKIYYLKGDLDPLSKCG